MAGAGNDTIVGGIGNDVLMGGTGNDTLYAHGGAKVMIGGAGADVINGGSGRNILIGGTTNFDANDTALGAILDEWSSNDGPVTAVNRLRGDITGGQNGTTLLTSATVHNDNVVDQLFATAIPNWTGSLLPSPMQPTVTRSRVSRATRSSRSCNSVGLFCRNGSECMALHDGRQMLASKH